MKNYKQLPNGLWVGLGNLDPITSDLDVQKFLEGAGIVVPLDHISVSKAPDDFKAGSVFVLSRDELVLLVTRAINDQKLHGRVPKVYMSNLKEYHHTT